MNGGDSVTNGFNFAMQHRSRRRGLGLGPRCLKGSPDAADTLDSHAAGRRGDSRQATMPRTQPSYKLLLLLSVTAFGAALAVFLCQRFVATGIFQTLCEAAVYVLVSGAMLMLSYGLFVKAASEQGEKSLSSRH